MPSYGILGAGGKLQYSTLPVSVYNDIAGVVHIGGPDATVTDVDISNLQSASVAKEYIPGMYDGGTVEVDINYDHLQWSTLYSLYRTLVGFKILFSDGSNWTFNGYINHFNTDIPLDEQVTSPIGIKVTGKPVFTP
jgi:hypothetical protein